MDMHAIVSANTASRFKLRFEAGEQPEALLIRLYAERMERSPYILWWGGQERGWIRGYDPQSQAFIAEELHRALWGDDGA